MFGLLLAGFVASEVCAPFEKVDEFLKSAGEKVVVVGLAGEGYVLIYATPDGATWTIVSVDVEAKACLLADGGMLKIAAPGKGI